MRKKAENITDMKEAKKWAGHEIWHFKSWLYFNSRNLFGVKVTNSYFNLSVMAIVEEIIIQLLSKPTKKNYSLINRKFKKKKLWKKN